MAKKAKSSLARSPGPKTWDVRPIGTADFAQIERLFGANGACGGCWCMFWRAPSVGAYWNRHKGAKNKRAFRNLVKAGRAQGVLAFLEGQPIGWCSFGPREHFPYLTRSRRIPAPDLDGVWSITCFYIPSGQRRQGLSRALIHCACTAAQKSGALYIEGYPSVPQQGEAAPAFVHTGLAGPFLRLGFKHVADAGARMVVRKQLGRD